MLLLDYLAQRFRYHDARGWTAVIAAGHVEVEGRRARAETHVHAGNVVTYHKLHQEPFAVLDVRVLHEDADLLALDKPAHLPMHADGPFVRNTLVQVMRQRFDTPELSLVHRLDRETSGVCVVARTATARTELQRQFLAGSVRKVYHAIVRGHVAAPFTVALPIGRSTESCIQLRRAAGAAAANPQDAHTAFWPEAHGDRVTLLRCEPTTGRTHQIRVHLEANGTPIVGDKLYGRPDADYLAFVARVKANGDARVVPAGEVDRHLLHASELVLRHPRTGATATYRAPLPACMQTLVPVVPPPTDA